MTKKVNPIKVTVVREIEQGGPTKQVLVTDGTKFYVVSSVVASDTGKPETLVFLGSEDGKVLNYHDIAGGINVSRKGAIADLEKRLNENNLITGVPEDYLNEVGGVFGLLNSVLNGVTGKLTSSEVDDDFIKD